jgi:transcriptional regulator with XRE-family HTH domain
MAVSLDRMMERFSAEERAQIDAHARQLITQEMTLRELRQALGKTQSEFARKLNKPQTTISRMERQSDMLLSTLDRAVQALGGRVRIIAELPGRPAVELAGLTDVAPLRGRTSAKSVRPRKRAARRITRA